MIVVGLVMKEILVYGTTTKLFYSVRARILFIRHVVIELEGEGDSRLVVGLEIVKLVVEGEFTCSKVLEISGGSIC